jgi:hypothetical protein
MKLSDHTNAARPRLPPGSGVGPKHNQEAI